MPSHNSLILTPGVADRVGTIFSSLVDSAVNVLCCQLDIGNWTLASHVKKSNVMYSCSIVCLHSTLNFTCIVCDSLWDLKPHNHKVEVHWKPTTSKLSSPSLQSRASAALVEMVLLFGTLRTTEPAFAVSCSKTSYGKGIGLCFQGVAHKRHFVAL